MRISLSAALLAAALGLGAAGAAWAQTETPAASAPAVKAGPPSIDWPIEDLLADPGAKSVIVKDLPGIEDDPRLDMVKTLSLRTVAQYPEAQIDQAKLDAIQAELAALPRPTS